MDNVSIIFFLSGLNENRSHRLTLFALTLLYYCLIVLLNVSLVVTIILDRNLHEPMYILLCTLCINGLYGSTGFYPKFLWDLLTPVQMISYSGCLFQAWVLYSYACSELSILAVMAFDRYVAICRPLEYHSIMSKQTLSKLACFSWLTPFCVIGSNIFLTSRVKLCRVHIAKLFCVNWIIVNLACFPADTYISSIVANLTIIIYVAHCGFIVWSYILLIKTCLNSIENRGKFMKTCVPHLTSLTTFLLVLLFDIMSMRINSKVFSQNLQNFFAMEFLLVPPILNPLIYGFKISKIRSKMTFSCHIQIIGNVKFLTLRAEMCSVCSSSHTLFDRTLLDIRALPQSML